MSEQRDEEQDTVFTESLATLSLTDLQDVFGHLDRDRYPDRIEAVRSQMQTRIEQLGMPVASPSGDSVPAGIFRRLWGNLLDVFISLFPLVIYMGSKMLSSSSGGGGRAGGRGGGRPRGRGGPEPEESFIDQVVTYLTSPEALWDAVETYGPWLLGFMVYRALYVLPQLMRSGVLPGMREAGLRVESDTGERLRWKQAILRFVTAYGLGILTLGVSHLWSIWDHQNRTLFDRFAGTRVLRASRRWEKPVEQRLLED
jgi:uncharacterized RDD family membrane protein YckC